MFAKYFSVVPKLTHLKWNNEQFIEQLLVVSVVTPQTTNNVG